MVRHFLAAFLFLFLFSECNSQINIDTASFTTVFKQLNFDVKNFVAIGEAHTIKNTYGTELFIIKNLAEKGYKNIYIEYGHAEAAILNMYMNSGDSTILHYSMAKWWDAAYYLEFLKPLYKLNKEKGYGFTFKGFDFERPYQVGFLFSKWFGDAKINTIDFKKLSDYLLAQDEHKYQENIPKLKIIMDSLKRSFSENENRYREILKDNFTIFKNIIFNPISDFDARDDNFVKTMLELQQTNDLNKAIIITGNHHILFKNRFIPLLADKLPDSYSIYLFPFIYQNCDNRDDNKKYSSLRKFLKYLDKRDEKKPLIRFTKDVQHMVPSGNKNIFSVVVGLYNE